MVLSIHHRYAYPLWWDLSIITWEWALLLRIKIRLWLTDGSGRREYVTSVRLSVLCLHWDIDYAWGRRRYRPEPERILSFSEVMDRRSGQSVDSEAELDPE